MDRPALEEFKRFNGLQEASPPESENLLLIPCRCSEFRANAANVDGRHNPRLHHKGDPPGAPASPRGQRGDRPKAKARVNARPDRGLSRTGFSGPARRARKTCIPTTFPLPPQRAPLGVAGFRVVSWKNL
jgi:hypothetical protein